MTATYTKHCVVADLRFDITLADTELLAALAPRYAPFAKRLDEIGEVPQLFSLTQTERFGLPADMEEVTTFDCEGAQCTFMQNRTNQVAISLTMPDSCDLMAQLLADADYTNARCWLSGDIDTKTYCINNFLMMLFAFSSMQHETLLFHASVIGWTSPDTHAMTGYLFLGPSGTGKSTHTGLWLQHIEGSELINDDNPAVGIRQGQAIVYGTPWSGKTPCYRNVSCPAGAFVRLQQRPSNTIKRNSVVESFAVLLPSCSGAKWDKIRYRALGNTITTVLSKVPVYTLGCLPDKAAARLSHQTLCL